MTCYNYIANFIIFVAKLPNISYHIFLFWLYKHVSTQTCLDKWANNQSVLVFTVYALQWPQGTPSIRFRAGSALLPVLEKRFYGPKQQNFEIIVINRKRSETSKTHQTHDTALFSGTVHSTSFLFTNRFSLSFSSPFRCFLIGNHNLGKLLNRSQTRI